MTSRWRGGRKPLDFGTGQVAASLSSSGAWLSLGGPHPVHGFVELTGVPPFDESARGKPELVRRHRWLMTVEESAFLWLEGLPPGTGVTYRIEPAGEGRGLAQLLRITTPWGDRNLDEVADSPRLVFRGRLDRPALAMITEVSPPLPRTQAMSELRASGSSLRTVAPSLPAEAEVIVESAGEAVAWRPSAGDAYLPLRLAGQGDTLELRVEVRLEVPGLSAVPGQRAVPAGNAQCGLGLPREAVPPEFRADLAAIAARALSYVRDCTCLRVAPDRVAILTDHRLLPLSWTRDAYFQALLLLRYGELELIADHLRWLWLDCDRPDASWARSHLANGRRRDEVFQADQQLYPLLELAHYRRMAGHLPPIDARGLDWGDLVARVLDLVIGRMSSGRLIPTDENAADDPAAQPYLLANQVLAAYTFDRLAPVAAQLGLAHPLGLLAGEVREAARSAFLVDGPDGRLWAYSVDGRGSAELYHDANEVPTALAPLLGFCSADDPAWRATMDFAFGPHNPAYAAGEYGGLGSRHTPGTWPLGLIQEWAARSLTGQRAEAADALRRLIACALSDGSLPEASDPASARVLARHWFAWPGALLGILLPDNLD